MKIVVTGKGGVGKTTVAGTLARVLARRGHPVVAVDCDPSPNLGITLALGPEQVESQEAILNGLVRSGHTHHSPKPDPEELLARYGVRTAEGIHLVAVARIERLPDACMCCGSHRTAREFWSDLSGEGRIAIADLEAGLSDLIWVRPGPEDTVVVVSDGSAKALEVARRAREIASLLGVVRVVAVANEAEVADSARLGEALGVPAVAVPCDPAVAAADHRGVSPMDADPRSPAMTALAELAEWLVPG